MILRVPSLQIVESATVEDGVVRLRSADGWISYLHAITVSHHDRVSLGIICVAFLLLAQQQIRDTQR